MFNRFVRILAVLCFAAIVPGAAQAQTKYKLEGNEVVLPGPVEFEAGSDKIKAESDPVLEIVRAYLAEKSAITLLRIEGHTDTDGSASTNQQLSEKRALAVARWLVSKGVDCKRVIAIGFGGTKPIAPNDSPANKAANRRITFVNAGMLGRQIGGLPPDGGGKSAGDACK